MDWDGMSKENMELAVLPVPSGPPHRLGIKSNAAAWSPDGKKMVLAQHNVLYMAKSDGSEIHKLVTVEGEVYALRFSRDGVRIRFTQNQGYRGSSLWEMRADGSGLRPLLPGWHSSPAECCGFWTPDGRNYIFQSVDASGQNLWALREGRDWSHLRAPRPVRLTSGPMAWVSAVSSHDGKKLYAIGKQWRGEVVRFDVDARQFVPFLSGMQATDIDFSRDGQWMSYVSIPDGVLWRSRVDGRERLRLTDASMKATLPRWSPDGKQIAFMGLRKGKPWKIFMVPADGGSVRELLAENYNEADPTWSSDGKSLAFGRLTVVDSGGGEPQAIFVLNLESGVVKELPGSIGLFSPRWSPNGRYISAQRTDFSKLVVFDVQTQKWSDWVTAAADYPVWSQDSKAIYFDHVFTDDPALCVAKLGDSHFEKLVPLGQVNRLVGTWGPWIGLAPDASPLMVRDISPQEVYAMDVEW